MFSISETFVQSSFQSLLLFLLLLFFTLRATCRTYCLYRRVQKNWMRASVCLLRSSSSYAPARSVQRLASFSAASPPPPSFLILSHDGTSSSPVRPRCRLFPERRSGTSATLARVVLECSLGPVPCRGRRRNLVRVSKNPLPTRTRNSSTMLV
jgi:hypothetical protein